MFASANWQMLKLSTEQAQAMQTSLQLRPVKTAGIGALAAQVDGAMGGDLVEGDWEPAHPLGQ
jgi:hypothetical protein